MMAASCSAISAARASSPLLSERTTGSPPSTAVRAARRLLLPTNHLHKQQRVLAQLRPLRASSIVAAADADDEGEVEGGEVVEVTSKQELNDLIAAGAAGGKLVVLEVRKQKGSAASEEFAPRFCSMAADFSSDATFAK